MMMLNKQKFTFLVLIIITSFIPCTKQWCKVTRFSESLSQINEIDVNIDSTKLVTGGNSQKVTVWNFTTIQPIYVQNFGNNVNSVKFSKKNQYIAVATTTSTVTILKASDYSAVTTITTNCTSVSEIDFNWDDSKILICGSPKIQVFYVGNWSWIASNNNGGNYISCKFQKDGRYAGGDNQRANMYYPNNTLQWSNNIGNTVNSLDFDMLNYRVVFADQDQKLYAFQSTRVAAAGTAQTALGSINLSEQNTVVAYMKDGSGYAMGGNSGTLWINNSTDQKVYTWKGSAIRSAVFTYDSKYLFIGSTGGVIDVFKRMCTACPEGTYQSPTECLPCAMAMIGCQVCANSSYCNSCANGYALNTTTNNCSRCQTLMPGCAFCNSTTFCQACASNYFVSGSSNCSLCSQNLPGCVSCRNSTACSYCSPQFYMNFTSFTCNACSKISNCLRCLNQTACTQCAPGYLSNSSLSCILCPNNCTSCFNQTLCTQCLQNYFMNSTNMCNRCPYICLTCTSLTVCTSCIQGYYSSGTLCSICTNNCLRCNSTTCFDCSVGYYLSAGTCFHCVSNCLTCINSTLCLSCNVHYYYLQASNSCNQCQNLTPFCLDCSNTTCLACQPNFYLDSGTCTPCLNGCSTCLNITSCLTCISGYYLNSNNKTCSLCTIGCSKCWNSTFCSSCLPQYYLTTSNTCQLCSNNCLTCTNVTCLSCRNGYFINGTNQCANCSSAMTHCLTCFSSSICITCEPGYFVTSTNTSCTQCSWPCSKCLNQSTCLLCSNGYYLNSANTCILCTENCSNCLNSTNCSSCVNGFYLQSNFTCQTCNTLYPGCQICNSSTCTKCLNSMGYYLNSTYNCTNCQTTITNCITCSNSSYCQQCNFGYYPVNFNSICKQCSSLISNCQHCSANNSCLTCFNGYYNNAGQCSICPEGCFTCFNATQCFQCSAGYTLQSNVCTFCRNLIMGCELCSSTSTCVDCVQGYYFSAGSCNQCNQLMQGCFHCNNSNTCISCLDEFYLNSTDNVCYKCSNTTYGCKQCTQPNNCLTCLSGFFKNTSNICSPCLDSHCIICYNASICTLCETGAYLLANGSCSQCNSFHPSCLLCNNTQCLQCSSGFYINSTQGCSSCQVNGCQICNSLSPTQCVTCQSLYYKNITSNCILCNTAMIGCLHCINNTQCISCESGYYLSAANNCLLCSILYPGCTLCSLTGCTKCQGGYLLNLTTCITCIQQIPGCLYCTSPTICLSCQSGYYIFTNSCLPCTSIAGCLDCTSSNVCLHCGDNYFLNTTNLCSFCNTTLPGCIQCSSSSVCMACLGNYQLSGGQCTQIKTQSTMPYQSVRFTTYYIDSNTLLHKLIVKGQFSPTLMDLTTQTNITLIGNGLTIVLTITKIEWPNNNYQIYFYTNNPLNLDSQSNIMKPMDLFSIRLLTAQNDYLYNQKRLLPQASINLNYKFKLDMSQNGIQAILPSSDHLGSLSLKNPVDDPNFIKTLYKQKTFNYHYFGLITIIFMIVIYFVKATVTVPKSDDQGQIIPHILALKCCGMVYTTVFAEYMDYCYGWMSLDFPWMNELTSPLSMTSDLSPNSYLLFYNNLTIASTYLFALAVIISIIIIILIIAYIRSDLKQSLKTVGIFFFNVFQVGLVLAGILSIQGAYYNGLNQITQNSIYYLLGILLFMGMGVGIIVMIYRNPCRIDKLRVFAKIVILSLLFLSPLYLVPVVFASQIVFIVIQYSIKKTAKIHPHLWIVVQLLVNAALFCLLLLADSLLGIFISAILVISALILDLFIHIKQFKHSDQIVKVQQIHKLTKMLEGDEKKRKTAKRRNDNLYENTKQMFISSNSLMIVNQKDDDLSIPQKILQRDVIAEPKRKNSNSNANQQHTLYSLENFFQND